jgi:hypothetical protein
MLGRLLHFGAVGLRCPWRIEYPPVTKNGGLILNVLKCGCEALIERTCFLALWVLQRRPLEWWRR